MTHATRRPLLVTCIALFSTACGAEQGQAQDKRGTEGVSASITSVRLEMTRHEDAVANLSTLTALPVEIDRHDHIMSDIVGMMGMGMDGMMSRCSGSGMGVMPDSMDAILSEMRSDREAMAAATTLSDARNECAAHIARVNGTLKAMEQSLDTVSCTMMGH